MERFEQLVKALRCKRDDCEGCDLAFFDKDEGWMCQYAAKDDDAAAAIEDLQAQLPKRGEWILQASGQDCKCSVCESYWIPFGDEYDYKFCPNCGAKMEVQDG